MEKNYNPEQKNAKISKKQENLAKAQQTEQVKKEEKKIEEKEKKPAQKKPVAKKDYAVANARDVPLSAKVSFNICRFIKGKTIENAIADLEQVIKIKKAVPMKGEFGHKSGMMSGKYPVNASKEFIKILKGLKANANINGLEEPIITEARGNFAPRPFGRFGRFRRKRAHITIKVTEKKQGEKK